jgi:integrase/recombinase XerD
MLTDDVVRYLSLRRSLGFKLREVERHLRAWADFATERGDRVVRTATAMEWAAAASSPHDRHVWLRDVVRFARFVRAEDPAHEVPPLTHFRGAYVRPLPYIYTSEEIARILAATERLRPTYPLRRRMYATLFGLIAATGLRISEALNLRIDHVRPDGVLLVEETKFRKSRLVPLHPTTQEALDRYLDRRRRVAADSGHLFLSAKGRQLPYAAADFAFRRLLEMAGIAPGRVRRPRIHDLRHRFATRALENCGAERRAVSRHFVALSTYLGHVDIKGTYWYLEATPNLMTDMASAAEALAAGGVR